MTAVELGTLFGSTGPDRRLAVATSHPPMPRLAAG
jgi:hypothetical protein